MEQQFVLQSVLQEKKNILLPPFQYLPREDTLIIIIFQPLIKL